MSDEKLDEALAEIKAYIEQWVAVGFAPPDEILSRAVDVFSDEIDPGQMNPPAERYLSEALKKHAARQATWPEITDCDRLDAAFAELEAEGIAAVQNGLCCQTCAMEDVRFAMKQMQKKGQVVCGYTFFHEQDTEGALVSDTLFLAYGSVEKDKKKSLEIGHEIAEKLQAHGFTVEWDGTIRKRIKFLIKWQKRR